MIKNDNKKKSNFFCCKLCHFTTSRLYNWERHILTPKHKMITKKEQKEQKNVTKSLPENFDNETNDIIISSNKKKEQKEQKNVTKNTYFYSTDEKLRSEFSSQKQKHVDNSKNGSIISKKEQDDNQKKQKNNITTNDNNIIKEKTNVTKKKFFCDFCNKSFAYQSGLSRHKQKCYSKAKNNIEDINITLLDKIEKNIDAKNKELLSEIDKKLKTNVAVNQQFNVNIFLNQDCKNAMNLGDFIESLRISMEDLHYTKDNGYAPGIGNILNKYLINLKPTERPIHCSNKEKLHFYIKSENTWKEDEGEQLNKKIDDIKQKQINKIKEWENINPNWRNDEISIQEYLKIVNNVYGNGDDAIEFLKIKQLISNTTQIDAK